MKRVYRAVLLGAGLVVLVVAIFVFSVNHLGWFQKPTATSNSQIRIMNSAEVPLTFVENQGQWDETVQFMARHRGMVTFLQKDALTLKFEKRFSKDQVKGVALHMVFEGASEGVVLEAEQPRSSVYNFFVGNDPSRWRSEVTGYARVVYRGLYEGIDLCLREKNGWLEYDLLLEESADLSGVVIQCNGIEGLNIDSNGSLVMETACGPITQEPPTAWYEHPSDGKMPVVCQFRKVDECRYGFEVSERDLSLALVIDPDLEWSTFLGGSTFSMYEEVMGVALNASGDIVVTGCTASDDFPIIAGAYQPYHAGAQDAYVACLSADGDSLIWSTFLGGFEIDWTYGVVVDASGLITVAGLTESWDFPVTQGAYQTAYGGNCDAFVSRLSAVGDSLIWSTFLGGSWGDWALRLAVNGSGETYVAGYTLSPDFPTTFGAYDTSSNGLRDAFVTRLNADGTDLVYSTYLGGGGHEGYVDFDYPIGMCYTGMALHSSGDVIISGLTLSDDFPTTSGAYDTTFNPSYYYDAFVTRLNAAGSDLVFSTFLGGSDGEGAIALAVDENGVVTVGGYTYSPDFPTTDGAYDTTFHGATDINDGFLSRLNADGSVLLYSTFIGGSSYDPFDDVNVSSSGEIIAVGYTYSMDYPTTPGAYDTTHDGITDAVICRLAPNGSGEADLLYSTYLGGWGIDGALRAVLVDDSTVIVGGTGSYGFPVTGEAYDTSLNNVYDGFVCRFGAYVGVQEATTDYPQSSITLSPIFPNPSHGDFSYSINLLRATRVQVSVFDITGRLVKTLIDKELPAGNHNLTWNAKSLENFAGGIYYLRLDANSEQQTRKFIMLQ
jgi:hypothetical protein